MLGDIVWTLVVMLIGFACGVWFMRALKKEADHDR